MTVALYNSILRHLGGNDEQRYRLVKITGADGGEFPAHRQYKPCSLTPRHIPAEIRRYSFPDFERRDAAIARISEFIPTNIREREWLIFGLASQWLRSPAYFPEILTVGFTLHPEPMAPMSPTAAVSIYSSIRSMLVMNWAQMRGAGNLYRWELLTGGVEYLHTTHDDYEYDPPIAIDAPDEATARNEGWGVELWRLRQPETARV